jgi:PTH1 family peptidyl-tRNA hydrolase
LVVGLGNPGTEFAGSRHNVGAEVVGLLASRHGGALAPMRGQRASVAEVVIGGSRVALAVPATYMNESGEAVRPLVRRFGVDDLRKMIVVHDELDLAPGRLKVKIGGGTAGHNGLRSLQAHLHDLDFVRVRIGVGKPPDPRRGADHVLRRPAKGEQVLIETAEAEAADAVELILRDGVEAAMTRYNAEP